MSGLLNPFQSFGTPPAGSNVSTFTGSFLSGTAAATNTVVVTGVGFQPKVVLFYWNGLSGSGTILQANALRCGIGVGVSSSSRWTVGGQSDTGLNPSATDFYNADESCVRVLSTAGALAGALDVVTMDSDGFTLVVDTQFTADLRVHYLAIGGTDITNLKTGTFLEPAATGSQATTGVGFVPDVLIFGAGATVTSPPTQAAHHIWSLGMAVRGSNQALVAIRDRDGQSATLTQHWQSSGSAVGRMTFNTDALASQAAVTSYDADGFTLNWTARAVTGVFNFYLAIKGGSWACGELLTQTDTVTTSVVSGLAFQPKGLLFMTDSLTEHGTTLSGAELLMGIGAATSASDRNAIWIASKNSNGTAACTAGQREDAAILTTNGAGTLRALMDIQSINSDGFTAIMDDADAAQGTVYYLAVG